MRSGSVRFEQINHRILHTSVYISKAGISGNRPSAPSTLLATSPTPDAAQKLFGMRPARISATGIRPRLPIFPSPAWAG